MKNNHFSLIGALVLGFFAAVHPASGQGTAFTYQGRLNDGAGPANGSYDLQFAIYGSATGANDGFANQTNSATVVSNGLFVVTLDFGPGIFTGPDRWLEIGVRTNGGGGFATLSPRQKLTPTPYAIMAGSAGTLASGGLTGFRVESLPPGPSYSNVVDVAGGSPINGASGVAATVSGGGAVVNGFPFPNQADADFGTVSGGLWNIVTSGYGTIGGGFDNRASGIQFATVSGGDQNTASGYYTTVSGGQQNMASGTNSTVSGGYGNTASGAGAFIGGGGTDGVNFSGNTASGAVSVVGGGMGNSSGDYATVGGGSGNNSSGNFATVPGGENNTAVGNYSFAAGFRAKANHQGSFVWADSENVDFVSTTNDQFLIRAGGGVGINKNNPAATLDVSGTARIQGANNWDVNNTEGDFRVGNDVQRFKIGVATDGSGTGDVWMRAQGGTARVFIKTPGGTTFYSNEGQTAGVSLAANGTAWAVVSDRNVKKDFAAINSVQILEKLAAMPITQWHYKWETSDVTPHIGPMAQDFKAAFYPGTDDKSITTQEADGVALAAIQGLNEKVESQRAELNRKESEIADLKQRMEVLERLMRGQAAK